jgi:uncharacterized radical SAM superfamily Fe-S cluster-containing enzyme
MPDREYRFVGPSRSLCPVCRRNISAKIVERTGEIRLLKRCPEHGHFDCLIERDADWYLNRKRFDKPGTLSKTQTDVRQGCPYDCGLCPDHEQHTCIALLELTSSCGLNCPVCYADAQRDGEHLSMDRIEAMIRFFVDSEYGRGEILQLSGGEPTEHPEVLSVIAMARDMGLRYVMLNTNGRRIAEDPTFADALTAFEDRFEVYLQFDGFQPDSYRRFRGSDLSGLKQRALDALVTRGIPVTLVSTVERGVNETEIGPIVAHALERPFVRGINFQPLSYCGRIPAGMDPANRITMTGVLREIEKQCAGTLKVTDFVPLPCNVDSVAVTYLYRQGKSFTPITRQLDVADYLPHIDNSFLFDSKELWQRARADICCDLGGFWKGLSSLLPRDFGLRGSKAQREYVNSSTFRISVSSFLDPWNFEHGAMMKECVHVLTPDLKKIPFSAHNILHREARGATP